MVEKKDRYGQYEFKSMNASMVYTLPLLIVLYNGLFFSFLSMLSKT